MCDTFVALGNSTRDGSVIFGKNTDREPNEAHLVCILPAAEHAADENVKCTYIEIPQVAHTYQILLAKPFWIWGAEMGANEHGLVIGNEAVFTKVPYSKEPGLIGMDFIRLTLERCKTAREGLELMTMLLAQYGQGGNCGFTHEFYYHNSFILADAHEAWVLETAGRIWAAEKVRDIRTISNALTIGSTWDLASPDLVSYAIEKGYCKNQADFDFARCYSDLIYTRFGDGHHRQACSTHALMEEKGKIDVSTAMNILRLHSRAEDECWSPDAGVTGAEVCMHAGFGPIRGSQSVGSMVSQIRPDGVSHWVTGTSGPCTGVFYPVWMDAGLPEMVQPTGTYDTTSDWWQHELLHRETLRDYATRWPVYQTQRVELENTLMVGYESVREKSKTERAAFTKQSIEKIRVKRSEWIAQVKATAVQRKPAFYYSMAWDKWNKEANIHLG